MDQPGAAPPAPQRSSWGIAILALLVIGGSALGVLVYQAMQGGEAPVADTTGFDLAETAPGTGPAPSGAASAVTADPSQAGASSSLGMVQTGLPGMQIGGRAKQPPGQKAKTKFTDLVRQGEARMRALRQKYEQQYPVIRQYQQDWNSYPDLRKLRDDYRANHDPVAFMRGLAESKNFGTMVKKYAGQAPVQAFVKDAIKQAPSGFMSAAMDYLNDEKVVRKVVDNVGSALGLPPGLLGSSGSQPQVDEKAVMDSVMKSNPDLQKALDNPAVQKNLPNQPR